MKLFTPGQQSAALRLKRAVFGALAPMLTMCCLLLVAGEAQAQTTYANTTASATDGIDDVVTPCSAPLIRTFVVSTSSTVTDVDIGVLLAHTYRGDLIMRLRSPVGTVVTFNNQTGENAQNFNILVSDEAASSLAGDFGTYTATGTTITPPYAATRSPSSPLSAFDGENAAGTWQLEICDNAAFDSGTFYRAHLIITSTAAANVDLSLTKTASNPSPTPGSPIAYTLTVTNAASSNQAATVVVQDTLPAGFTFTGWSGDGSYDTGSGQWTVGAVPVGGSASITITGTVNATAGTTVTNIAEIIIAPFDPDSTPNNAAPGEDDYAAMSFTVASGRTAGTPPNFVCPTGQTSFDWDLQGWPPGSTNNNFTIATLGTVNVAISNPAVWMNVPLFGGQSPIRQNVMTGGLSPSEISLIQIIDFATSTEVATTIISLPVAVPAARFTIFDVDFNNGQFADRVRVTATYNGVSVPVTLTNGVANYVVGDQAFGDILSADGSADGNVVVTINQPVDVISIEYGNHSLSPSDPGGQAITLHDITFCQPDATVVLVKSHEITSIPANAGPLPFHIPGAVLRTCLLLSNSGSAAVTNANVSDTLPANVTYVPGSLRFGPTCASATSVEDDDATGADEAPEGAAFASGVITATVSSLAAGATRALTFDVTLN
jgi:uncharacterized repeat protein (TIGR01451 family)